MEEDDATNNVDSSERILKERTEADFVSESIHEDQYQGEAKGVTTPHVLLPLQEPGRLKETIKNILKN